MAKEKNPQRLSNTSLEMLLFVGLVWLQSSYAKLAGGEFVAGMSKTLGYFASKNPNPFVKSWLMSVALPHASLFGVLTVCGETFVALAMTISIGYMLWKQRESMLSLLFFLAGTLGGMFLNMVFWWVAGWTSPSTASLNALMFGVQLIGFATALKHFKRMVS